MQQRPTTPIIAAARCAQQREALALFGQATYDWISGAAKILVALPWQDLVPAFSG
ncbi:MAG: hypothetical protein VB140_04395 [Burkholderia sp.]